MFNLDSLVYILDVMPGIGHAKAGIYYLNGEYDKAKDAWYKSTRSLAVTAGGMVGTACGGPALGAYLAVTSGGAIDVTYTIATEKTQGIVRNVEEAHKDILNDRIPIMPIANAALTVSNDSGLSKKIVQKLIVDNVAAYFNDEDSESEEY